MLDDDLTPHVMDFGLAKRDAGEVTMTLEGQVLGTPAYTVRSRPAARATRSMAAAMSIASVSSSTSC